MGNDQKKATKGPSQYHPDIVIVSENKGQNQEDTSSDVNKLDYVPLFYPILKNSIDVREENQLFQINPDSMVQLSEALKTHLNSCAYNVTKDQEAISTEIKHNFVEKQRKYAKYCEQFKTVSDLAQSLRKIQRSMDEIVPMMKEINECLPDSDRLEEFSFK